MSSVSKKIQNLPELLPLIQQCLLFANLNSEQIASVLSSTRVTGLREDETLFEQQQPAHDFSAVVLKNIAKLRLFVQSESL